MVLQIINSISKLKFSFCSLQECHSRAETSLELSAAKRERDFYLSKVDKSRALSSIEERLKKKQKVQQDAGTNTEAPANDQGPKVIRQFPQKPPLADKAAESKPRLSKDILAGVFGGSS
ncbi:hypothetical protein CK203_003932 [Vitis vinifera]|uniref:Uncharacterized protein n=1 Tax=Vitis vinifera TaxID=29760 RepID=A0A438K9K7_VITVI|nr:hypothetical protein CK203_003932 [Vitis vinifera]